MLKEKIRQDLNSALKEKKELEVSVLRLLSAVIFNKEKEKRYKISKEKPGAKGEELEKESQLTDEEVVDVISSEVKKRKEAVFLVRQKIEGAREKEKIESFINKEEGEIEILEKYLPEQLSEKEIKNLAREAIEKIGATGFKDIGKVMAELMPRIKGKAEGGLVSKIVKELLQ